MNNDERIYCEQCGAETWRPILKFANELPFCSYQCIGIYSDGLTVGPDSDTVSWHGKRPAWRQEQHEAVEKEYAVATEVRTIDLTPTNEGYAAIGAVYVAQLVQDFKASRASDSIYLLRQLIDLAFAFGEASSPAACRDNSDEAIALKNKLFERVRG